MGYQIPRDAHLMTHTVVALPGLHGTAGLFDGLLRERPGNVDIIPIGYPVDRQLTYAQLTDFVLEKLPRDREYSLLAESFSGPVALRVARFANPRIVVLCASFVRSPVSKWFACLPLTALFSFSAPVSLLSRVLTGGNEMLASAVQKELGMASPRVLAHRVREIIAVDVSQEIRDCRCPIVYLRATSDRIIPAEVAAEFQALKSDTVVTNVNGPHLILQAASAKVWDSIKAYFQ